MMKPVIYIRQMATPLMLSMNIIMIIKIIDDVLLPTTVDIPKAMTEIVS